MLPRSPCNAERWPVCSRRSAHLPKGAHARIYTGSGRQDALLASVAPEVLAVETHHAIIRRGAKAELSAGRKRPFDARFADRRVALRTLQLVAGYGIGLVGHERRHAFLNPISVGVAARNAEGQAVDVIVAGARDPATEPLVR